MKDRYRLMLYEIEKRIKNIPIIFLFNFNLRKFIKLIFKRYDFKTKTKFFILYLNLLEKKLDYLLGKTEQKINIKKVKKKKKENKLHKGEILFLIKKVKPKIFIIPISKKEITIYEIKLQEKKYIIELKNLIDKINKIFYEINNLIKKYKEVSFNEITKDKKREEKIILFNRFLLLYAEGKVKLEQKGNEIIIKNEGN